MKYLHNSLFAGILLCCGFIEGCEKEVIVPAIEGNIVGYLYALDEYGLLSDMSGIKVYTRGFDGSYSAFSDPDGRFELAHVPAGTYELVFSKDGFVSDTASGIRHLGGQPTILGYDDNLQMYRWYRIYKIPTTTIQSISVENDTLKVETNFSGTPGPYISLMLYFSDLDNFEKVDAIIFSDHFKLRDGFYRGALTETSLPFEPGQTFYLKAAVLSEGHTSCAIFHENGYYLDCETGRIFYPILGSESTQFSLVFPE